MPHVAPPPPVEAPAALPGRTGLGVGLALAAALIGGVAPSLGWGFGWDALPRWGLDWPATTFATSVCFLVASLAALANALGEGRVPGGARRILRIASVVLLSISAADLMAEEFFADDLSRALMRDVVPIRTIDAMSSASATLFALIGVDLAARSGWVGASLGHAAAGAAATVSGFVATRYLFSDAPAEELFFGSMACPTALAGLCLSAALLIGPGRPRWMDVLLGPSAAAARARALAPAAALAPLAGGAVAVRIADVEGVPQGFAIAMVSYAAALLLCVLLASALVRQARDEAALQEARDAAALMATELHHRVKNMLQRLVAVIVLERMKTADAPAGAAALDAVLRRVEAMSSTYTLLLNDARRTPVPAAEFLEQLVGSIDRGEGAAEQGVTLALGEIAAEDLPPERAVRLGLIVFELVMNAIRHAYPAPGQGGRVTVSLRREGERLALRVADDGVGGAARVGAGTGTRVVDATVRELNGAIRRDGAQGMRVTVEIDAPRAAPA